MPRYPKLAQFGAIIWLHSSIGLHINKKRIGLVLAPIKMDNEHVKGK
ncbi:hypothetical protein [Amedibacillus sp. YH-ame10]